LGGKLSVFLSSLPTWGPGHLRFRDTDPTAYGTERETIFLQAGDIFYKNLGEKCAKSGIGVDLFIMSSMYVDIATVGKFHIVHLLTTGTLSCMTGGDTFLYSNFIVARDAPRVAGDFARTVTRETGYQGMMKVRCSNGLRVSDYDGNFFQNKPSEIEFGTIDADKAVVVMFKHEGKVERKLDVVFQSALLYTTATGERRVRVQNLSARSSNDVVEVFKATDEDAILVTIAKEASFKMLTKTSREVREGIVDKCIRILAAYRKHNGSGAHQGQLILPDKLRLLPLYTLGLMKTRAFRG
jgi:protein transport protein SEC24